MKRRNMNILTVLVAVAIALSASAQSIDEVKKGPNYKQFLKAVKKCNPDGTCKTERDAKMAKLKRRALIRACNSEFGASAAGPCIDKLLGEWKNVTFKKGVDPCEGYCDHGDCRLEDGVPKCDCHRGWTGERCDERIPDPCEGYCDHGDCRLEDGVPKCDCHRGWTGERCDERIGFVACHLIQAWFRRGSPQLTPANCKCYDGTKKSRMEKDGRTVPACECENRPGIFVAKGENPAEKCGPVCGDGKIEGDEQCDDGNTEDGDCCSSTCQLETPPPPPPPCEPCDPCTGFIILAFLLGLCLGVIGAWLLLFRRKKDEKDDGQLPPPDDTTEQQQETSEEEVTPTEEPEAEVQKEFVIQEGAKQDDRTLPFVPGKKDKK